MALSANTTFEVRTTANDTNGGGFVTGASGTDYSLQDAGQVTFNGTTVTASTGGVSSTITITGYTVAAGDVGNLLQINGGTNFINGTYQVVSVNTGLSQWTLDRNCTTGVGTGMRGVMGGALATIQAALTLMTVPGMTVYIKATALYSISAALTNGSADSLTVTTRIIGYGTTRGDGVQPEVKQTATANGFTLSTSGWSISDIYVNMNSKAAYGIHFSGGYGGRAYRCKVGSSASYGIVCQGTSNTVSQCEITGQTGTAAIYTGSLVEYCWIHDGSTVGITGFTGIAQFNVITNMSGGTSDGIQSDYPALLFANTIHGCGRDGIRITNTYPGILAAIWKNICTSNGGYGINFVTAASPSTVADPRYNYNAYKSNTSGNLNNVTAGSNDVLLTADPYTNAAGNNFTLNTTAGGGAAIRSVGFPGVIPGSPGTGYEDIGALRHQDPAGGGSGGSFTFS